MKAVNLYFLYLGSETDCYPEFEQALTNQYKDKQYKKEELKSLNALVEAVLTVDKDINILDGFYYGFSIPQISKEFDLLKIYKNNYVVNIELKSQNVGEERIKQQLLRNRHYLSHLGRTVYSYTFVLSDSGCIIYELKDNNLVEKTIDELVYDLIVFTRDGNDYYTENIDKLFKANDFLISPINSPQKFMEDNYFLTDHQENIKNRIIKDFNETNHHIWGISGSAGTGKTLLLYDIAKMLSGNKKVCVIHTGFLSEGHKELNNICSFDVIPIKGINNDILNQYDCILVDEAHRLYIRDFNILTDMYTSYNKSCVFSFDYSQVLSEDERERNIPAKFLEVKNANLEKLTDKIRTSKELASFIKNIIDLKNRPRKNIDYSCVDVLYADSHEKARKLFVYFHKNKGYKIINYTPSSKNSSSIDKYACFDNTHHVIGQEFDNVMIYMDENFKYDNEGRLSARVHPNPDYLFYQLWFEAVTRARDKLCILVINNQELFKRLVEIKNYNCGNADDKYGL